MGLSKAEISQSYLNGKPVIATELTYEEILDGVTRNVGSLPKWVITYGKLTNPVGSCLEIAIEDDQIYKLVLCRATADHWVVMDYIEGLPSFMQLPTVMLLQRIEDLAKVFGRLGSDVSVVQWLQYYTALGDVV